MGHFMFPEQMMETSEAQPPESFSHGSLTRRQLQLLSVRPWQISPQAAYRLNCITGFTHPDSICQVALEMCKWKVSGETAPAVVGQELICTYKNGSAQSYSEVG